MLSGTCRVRTPQSVGSYVLARMGRPTCALHPSLGTRSPFASSAALLTGEVVNVTVNSIECTECAERLIGSAARCSSCGHAVSRLPGVVRVALVVGSFVLCLSSAQIMSAASQPAADAVVATRNEPLVARTNALRARVVQATAPGHVASEEDLPSALVEVDAGPDEMRHGAERTPTPGVELTAEPQLPPAPVVAPSPLIALPVLAADVWSAEERYFAISGGTPDELIASAKASVPADAHGIDRASMAYAGPTVWQHQPSYVIDPSTGACTMTGVTSIVSYQATIPQWTSPSLVQSELLAWWQVVLEHIRQHEGQHIRIFAAFAAELPARVSGQSCDAWASITNAWSAELASAQNAFDAQEASWAFPGYIGPSGG